MGKPPVPPTPLLSGHCNPSNPKHIHKSCNGDVDGHPCPCWCHEIAEPFNLMAALDASVTQARAERHLTPVPPVADPEHTEHPLAVAVLAFAQAATTVNEAALGLADTLDWQDALVILKALRDAITEVRMVESSLAAHAYLKGPHGDIELAGIGRIGVGRSQNRTEWDHDGWKSAARAAVLDTKGIPHEVVNPETGEHIDLLEILAEVQDIYGAKAPNTSPLKALGIDPADYCATSPGNVSIQFKS